MKVYLAGSSSHNYLDLSLSKYTLESFVYFQNWQIPFLRIWESFMLDSGAFTFLKQQKSKNIDWDIYVEKYADFIIKHDVKLFFELDIDDIIGLNEVIRLRNKLEQLTGKKSIPVWHKSRGKDYFIKMCEDYDYIAIGGFALKTIKTTEYKYIKWFIKTAHTHHCKIHGLGFTHMEWLSRLNFDSVDSTSWIGGGRFGKLYYFKDGTINTLQRPQGKRVKYHKQIDSHNFAEWCKFQKYADNNL